TTTTSPSAIPLAARFAALIPTRHSPRIRATLLRQVWPLIVTVIGGRAPEPRAFTTSVGTTTPVALPEGITFPSNFMCVSSCRPVGQPTVPQGIPSWPHRWSGRSQPSGLGRRSPRRLRGQRDAPAWPNRVGKRAYASHLRAAPDRQVRRPAHQVPRGR